MPTDSPSARFSGEVRASLARTRKTPAELAEALNVSEATIYRRTADQSPWPLDDAMAAARYLDIPMAAVFGQSIEAAS